MWPPLGRAASQGGRGAGRVAAGRPARDSSVPTGGRGYAGAAAATVLLPLPTAHFLNTVCTLAFVRGWAR